MIAEDPGLNLLGSYGEWAERVSSEPGELSFARAVDGALAPEEWKRRGRARVLELVGPLPGGARGAIPTARTVRREEVDGLEVHELVWQLPYGPPTEAFFLKPAGARGPIPGVLALHDHGGVKRFGKRKIADTVGAADPFVVDHRARYYGGRAWANELARRGFGVLVHDAFSFESRRVLASGVPAHVAERLLAGPAHPPPITRECITRDRRRDDVDLSLATYEAFASRHEDVVARSLCALGFSMLGVTLAEDRAALGVLAARPEVDPSRVGCCGLSGGGLRGVFLAGLSDAVACAVVVGFMSTWKDFALWNSYIHTWALFVPGLARCLDFPEILGLRAPLPSLVLACDRDLLFDPREVRRAESLLARIYRETGASEKARTSHVPVPHSFTPPMQEEAFRWLERWLGSERP